MIPRNLCNPNPATPSEKSFITPGQQMVSRTVGNDQNFQQSKRRRNQFPASIVDLSEKPLKQRNELGMFFDEVDEDDGVHTHRAAPEIGHQSHELRSRDRKSTRLKLQSHSDLVCRLLLEKKKKKHHAICVASTANAD